MLTSVIGLCLAKDLIFKDFSFVKLKIGRDLMKQFELNCFRVFAHATQISLFFETEIKQRFADSCYLSCRLISVK